MTRLKHHQVRLIGWVRNPSSYKPNALESLVPEQNSRADRYPEGGINLLYGQRLARESLRAAVQAASAKNDVLVPVDIKLSATRPAHANHWFDTWENKTIADLRRLSPSSEAILIRLWKKYLAEDGFTERDIRKFGWSRKQFIEHAPHYIDRLQEEEQFSGVDTFVWQTRESGVGVVRATLYNPGAIISIKIPSTVPIRVQVPGFELEAA